MEKQNVKTLLIDLDIQNNSINTIFNINKYNRNYNKEEIRSYVNKISTNLSMLCGRDLISNEFNEIEIIKMKELLNELKEEYDYIIIDISADTRYKYVKTVMSSSDKIIFLIEPNLLEIKKANNILEIYIKDWDINIDKIKIVFNKTNKYQIAEEILKEFFSEFKIIGNVKYNDKFNLFINKNTNENIEKIEFEQIYNKL